MKGEDLYKISEKCEIIFFLFKALCCKFSLNKMNQI